MSPRFARGRASAWVLGRMLVLLALFGWPDTGYAGEPPTAPAEAVAPPGPATPTAAAPSRMIPLPGPESLRGKSVIDSAGGNWRERRTRHIAMGVGLGLLDGRGNCSSGSGCGSLSAAVIESTMPISLFGEFGWHPWRALHLHLYGRWIPGLSATTFDVSSFVSGTLDFGTQLEFGGLVELTIPLSWQFEVLVHGGAGLAWIVPSEAVDNRREALRGECEQASQFACVDRRSHRIPGSVVRGGVGLRIYLDHRSLLLRLTASMVDVRLLSIQSREGSFVAGADFDIQTEWFGLEVAFEM